MNYTIEIMFDDLTTEKQAEIKENLKKYGKTIEDFNYETMPISETTIDLEE
jgi:hypothetical protein